MIVMNAEKIQKRAFKSLKELYILWLINKRDVYGYELSNKISNALNINGTLSLIYPILHKLEKNGYIKSNWQHKGRKPRKYYSITEKGRMLLERIKGELNPNLKEFLTDLSKK